MCIILSDEETPISNDDIGLILHYLSRCKHEIQGTRYLDWPDFNSEEGKYAIHRIETLHNELSMVRHRSHAARKYWKIVPAK
jgi:hypothetical protein